MTGIGRVIVFVFLFFKKDLFFFFTAVLYFSAPFFTPVDFDVSDIKCKKTAVFALSLVLKV